MKSREIPYQQIAVNPRMMIPRKSKGIVEISENTKNVSEIIKIPDRISGHAGILNISGLQYPIIPFFLTITEVFLI